MTKKINCATLTFVIPRDQKLAEAAPARLKGSRDQPEGTEGKDQLLPVISCLSCPEDPAEAAGHDVHQVRYLLRSLSRLAPGSFVSGATVFSKGCRLPHVRFVQEETQKGYPRPHTLTNSWCIMLFRARVQTLM